MNASLSHRQIRQFFGESHIDLWTAETGVERTQSRIGQ